MLGLLRRLPASFASRAAAVAALEGAGLAPGVAAWMATNLRLASAGDGRDLRWERASLECCPPNLVRFLAQMPGYVYAQAATGAIYVNLFASSRTTFEVNGKKVTLTMRSEMPWGGIHDIHRLPNGHFMVQRGAAEIVEIEPENGQVVWSYDSGKQGGNEGKPVEVHSFQPLADGGVMIAESGPARIIEINRDGKIQKTIPLKVEHEKRRAVWR